MATLTEVDEFLKIVCKCEIAGEYFLLPQGHLSEITCVMSRHRGMDSVGLDTYRGTTEFKSTASRFSLYSKNGGNVSLDNTGVVLRVESPISGDLLVAPVAKNRSGVRDPVSGTPMRYEGDAAIVKTPGEANQFMRSRKFYIDKDIDITIQTLRSTTKVTRGTNEKVGSAGTPTGMDPALLFYQGRR